MFIGHRGSRPKMMQIQYRYDDSSYYTGLLYLTIFDNSKLLNIFIRSFSDTYLQVSNCKLVAHMASTTCYGRPME